MLVKKCFKKFCLEKDGFTVFVRYPFPLREKYRYYIYSFKFADIQEMSFHKTNNLCVFGDFLIHKYRIRLMGKVSWNYMLEKRMGSKVYIPINSSNKKRIERMMEERSHPNKVR